MSLACAISDSSKHSSKGMSLLTDWGGLHPQQEAAARPVIGAGAGKSGQERSPSMLQQVSDVKIGGIWMDKNETYSILP